MAAAINPYSRDMLAEAMRIAAADDWQKLMAASFVKCSPDLCWRDFSVLAKTPVYETLGKEIISMFKNLPGFASAEIDRYRSHGTE